MKIVFCSAEMTPFASTGGLGEVSGALPRALSKAGDLVIPVIPMYRAMIEKRAELHNTGIKLLIPVGFNAYTAEVWINRNTDPEVYLIRRDEYFDRQGIYGNGERDYDDNLERYIFFQKSVIALIDELGLTPDIVHGHDWTSGLLPMFLRHGIHGMGRTCRERSVFTIHNLAYQGIFSASQFPVMNLPFSCYSIDTMEFFGKINCVKAGITMADRVTTVSQGYAREILTKEKGCGLDGVLRKLSPPGLTGISNGIDIDEWNPARDPFLTKPFGTDKLEARQAGTSEFLRELGLQGEDKPIVVGMIGRLVDQKGLDMVCKAMPMLMKLPRLRFILLGTGEKRYEDAGLKWMKEWPGRVYVHIGYSPALAHRIEAALDAHIVPSRFEPCGLGQFHALRYGALPVVNPTGGLADAITPLSADGQKGNGVVMKSLTPESLVDAVQTAGKWISNEKRWPTIQRRLMEEDHSWNRSASRYQNLFHALIHNS